ncbi:MAG: hypothetical protein E7331_10475 [Clostridiales bacterium]|nr:hypothetical protein [Clostridiales bacterium]
MTGYAKKTLAVLMTVMVTLFAAVAFAEHTHTFSETWDRNATEHWHACDCGEKTDVSMHVVDDIFCAVCGSEIWLFDDGTTDVFDYYENGDLRRNTFYDADGSVIGEYSYEYGYDGEGRWLWSKTWTGDFLVEETQYAVNEYGESLPAVQESYSEDGYRSRNEYDRYGNIAAICNYDEAGVLLFEELYEYTYSEEGMALETRISGRFDDGTSYVWVDNQYGDRISSVMYEADGTRVMDFTTDYGYDEMGNKLWYKSYNEGMLVEEATYAIHRDEAGSWSYEHLYTEYLEDGGRIVTEFDYEGSEVNRTEYDAQGSAVESLP